MGDLETVATCEKSTYAAKTGEECFVWKLIGDVLEDYLLIYISFWLTGIRARMHSLDNAKLQRVHYPFFLIKCVKWVMSSS
jgi:hypothetical protein